jgi:Tat protein secretion system quality control protein TatD with DNase activity
MDLFDTHAHLDDQHLTADVAGVVERAAAAGVTRILAVGTTALSSSNCLKHALQFAGVWSSAGIHPNHAAEALAADWGEIVRLSAEVRVVALGETGLDRHWHDTPFPQQEDYFARHLELSRSAPPPQRLHRVHVPDGPGRAASRHLERADGHGLLAGRPRRPGTAQYGRPSLHAIECPGSRRSDSRASQ